jgi:anti-anti-sigma factor
MDESKFQQEYTQVPNDKRSSSQDRLDKVSQDSVFIDLPGEPEMSNELEKVTESVRDTRNCDVFIDFSNVDIITSSSLSKLLKLRKLLGNHGCRLVLCNVADSIKGIFRIMGLEGIFEINTYNLILQRYKGL